MRTPGLPVKRARAGPDQLAETQPVLKQARLDAAEDDHTTPSLTRQASFSSLSPVEREQVVQELSRSSSLQRADLMRQRSVSRSSPFYLA